VHGLRDSANVPHQPAAGSRFRNSPFFLALPIGPSFPGKSRRPARPPVRRLPRCLMRRCWRGRRRICRRCVIQWRGGRRSLVTSGSARRSDRQERVRRSVHLRRLMSEASTTPATNRAAQAPQPSRSIRRAPIQPGQLILRDLPPARRRANRFDNGWNSGQSRRRGDGRSHRRHRNSRTGNAGRRRHPQGKFGGF
jgi:hypothetical protein